MVATIGMFGPDEEEIRAKINAENNQMALQEPSLTGSISALFNQGLYTAAEALGGGDPRIVKAKKMEQVKQYAMQNAKGNDTISYYKSLAEAFKKFGMMDEAYRVEMAIAALEDKDLDRQERADRAKLAADARQAALDARTKEATPEGQIETLLKTVYKDASTQSKIDAQRAVAKGVPVTEALYLLKDKDTGKPIKLEEGTGRPGEKREILIDPITRKPIYEGAPIVPQERTPLVQNTIQTGQSQYESAFEKELGKKDADYYGKLTENKQAAQSVLNLLNEIEPKLEKAYTGVFSNWKQGAGMVLSALGASTKQMQEALAATGSYQSVVKQLVLDQIKKLGSGTGISDADRNFVEQMTPRLVENPETIKEIIDYLRRRATAEITTYQEGLEFAQRNKGFRSADGTVWNKVPITPPPEVNEKQKVLRSIPPEQLDRMIKEKGGK